MRAAGPAGLASRFTSNENGYLIGCHRVPRLETSTTPDWSKGLGDESFLFDAGGPSASRELTYFARRGPLVFNGTLPAAQGERLLAAMQELDRNVQDLGIAGVELEEFAACPMDSSASSIPPTRSQAVLTVGPPLSAASAGLQQTSVRLVQVPCVVRGKVSDRLGLDHPVRDIHLRLHYGAFTQDTATDVNGMYRFEPIPRPKDRGFDPLNDRVWVELRTEEFAVEAPRFQILYDTQRGAGTLPPGATRRSSSHSSRRWPSSTSASAHARQTAA